MISYIYYYFVHHRQGELHKKSMLKDEPCLHIELITKDGLDDKVHKLEQYRFKINGEFAVYYSRDLETDTKLNYTTWYIWGEEIYSFMQSEWIRYKPTNKPEVPQVVRTLANKLLSCVELEAPVIFRPKHGIPVESFKYHNQLSNNNSGLVNKQI